MTHHNEPPPLSEEEIEELRLAEERAEENFVKRAERQADALKDIAVRVAAQLAGDTDWEPKQLAEAACVIAERLWDTMLRRGWVQGECIDEFCGIDP